MVWGERLLPPGAASPPWGSWPLGYRHSFHAWLGTLDKGLCLLNLIPAGAAWSRRFS